MKIYLYIASVFMLVSCSLEPSDNATTVSPTKSDDKLLVLCEGLWGADNSTISCVDKGTVINRWFQKNNPGMHLGDTGNDILQVNDTLIAICVNWSNIIQYIHTDGTAITATEDIPNNRKLATDGKDYLYCTSYANNGYVAKIDLRTKKIVDTCPVGYEPEGIEYYEGKLFIANTGGYAQQTGHEYESTVSVVDAETMKELKRIDTGCINLYGKIARIGQFLCINSAGDNYDVHSKTVVLNMANEEFDVFDFPATYSCSYGNTFYVVGSEYSYITGAYEYSMHAIEVPSMNVGFGLGKYSCAESLIDTMTTPYCLFISPFTAHLYVADARGNVTNGCVYEFSEGGELLNKFMLSGINPGNIIALK